MMCHKDDLREDQRKLQNKVNKIVNDLKFDDHAEIDYDGDKRIYVKRNNVLWLEYHVAQGWKEYTSSDLRNRRVAFLQSFAWDRMRMSSLMDRCSFYVNTASMP